MAEANVSTADRLVQVLDHLGIERAHFAASMLADVMGFARTHSERIASLTLVCPPRLDPSLGALGPRLLVIAGDQGRPAAMVRNTVASLPEATVVWLRAISVHHGPMWWPTALNKWKPRSSISSPVNTQRILETCRAMFEVKLPASPTTVKAPARRSSCSH